MMEENTLGAYVIKGKGKRGTGDLFMGLQFTADHMHTSNITDGSSRLLEKTKMFRATTTYKAPHKFETL
jgi:hypothetical protein